MVRHSFSHINQNCEFSVNKAHGTFIGTLRLEPNKPQQMFVDTEFKFGASTRTYVLRERPQMNKNFPSILSNTGSSLNESLTDQENPNNESLNASTLPESEAELEVNQNRYFFIFRLVIVSVCVS